MPVTSEQEILLEKYQTAVVKKEWRSYFVGAAARLASWSSSIDSNTNLDICIANLEGAGAKLPFWNNLFPAANYLLDATLNSPMDQVISQLIDLNNDLLVENGQFLEGLRDENSLIKDIYNLQKTDIYGFVAALALFDFHLSRSENFDYQKRSRPVELIPSVFNVIAEGFGLWALSRRWQRIFGKLKERERFLGFQNRFALAAGDREKIISRLVTEFQSTFSQREYQLTPDPRGPLWEYQSGYYDVDAANAISLQITCSNFQECYSALHWVESIGPVQFRLVRSSLFYPEPNGAKRLQTAVRLVEHQNRHLIARIGTLQTHLNNEWGLIYRIIDQQVSTENNQLTTISAPTQMIVNDIYGNAKILEIGSTVADFILKSYDESEAQYCKGASINATKANLGDKLAPGDIVNVSIDRQHLEILSKDYWYGQHITDAARNLAMSIDRSENELIERGRKKFILMIQNYLRSWGISLIEEDIPVVLSTAGYPTKRDREHFFHSLALEQSVNISLRQLFLQYYLRGRIVLANGTPIPVHWKEIKVAQCCNPKESDEIIGTQAFGPHNPENPRFGTIRELIVHRRGCKWGPSPRNALEIAWSSKWETKNKQGVQISYLLPDGRGLLGEIMDYIYSNTSLSVHYITADAVNFGREKAQIVLLASAPTEIEIKEAEQKLQAKYTSNVSFKMLNNRDVRLLFPDQSFCPYVLSSDPTLYSDAPLIMIGRINEINTLKAFVNDPRLNEAMVVGYYRTGKTRFLKHFKSNYSLPGQHTLYVSYDGAPQTKNPAEIPHEMYRQIKVQLTKLGLETDEQRPKSLYGLGDWINKSAQKNNCRFTLLLDEFSGIDLWLKSADLDRNFFDHFIRFMQDTKSTNFVLVFQAAQYYHLIDDYSGIVDYFRGRVGEGTINIKPFSKAEISELLNEPVQGDYHVTKEATDLVDVLTGGFPYLCSKLGRILWLNRFSLDEVKHSQLKKIWSGSLQEDEDWSSILNRMVEQLPQELTDLLRFISNEEFKSSSDLWQSPGELWVPQHKVMRFLKTSVNQASAAYEAFLNKLEVSSLLESREQGTKIFWRLRSDLLAFRLSKEFFSF